MVISIIFFSTATFGFVQYANADGPPPLKNLFVSAETSQFENHFIGSTVIEVVIIDSNIDDINIPRGEPDVTVNGKDLRMVQAVDGNWYGYFADREQAQLADETVEVAGVPGVGSDFGTLCPITTDISDSINFHIDISDTVGIAVPGASAGGVQGTDNIFGSSPCVISSDDNLNVILDEKQINLDENVENGQIGINSNSWPFIQLYNLNPTGKVVINYNKGGGTQRVELAFDVGSGFVLSKNSNFSTDDRNFETSDTIHVLAFSDAVDIDNMKKAEFKIQDSKKNRLKGNLDFTSDGYFLSSTLLASLEPGTAKVEIKLEDNNRNKFNVKENITILGTDGPPPPAEEFFNLSKNSDFSTEDREYTTSDTVFMKVFTDKEFATIKKTEYKIKMEDKTEVKGVLDDNGDGTFTASTDLLAFIGHEGIPKEFKLKVEGTDSGGGKLKVEFKPKITITS